MLENREGLDVAGVQLKAAEREWARAEAAYGEQVMSARDHDRARDELDAAQIKQRHANASAALEDDSLALELRPIASTATGSGWCATSSSGASPSSSCTRRSTASSARWRSPSAPRSPPRRR